MTYHTLCCYPFFKIIILLANVLFSYLKIMTIFFNPTCYSAINKEQMENQRTSTITEIKECVCVFVV